MPVVGVSVETIGVAYPNGAPAPTYDSQPLMAEEITSSGTSAASTGSVPSAATGGRSMIWRVASEWPIWIAFGPAPVAVAGSGRLLLGGVFECRANPGDKVAVINA